MLVGVVLLLAGRMEVALDGDCREMSQQLRAEPVAAPFGHHEQILEVDARFAGQQVVLEFVVDPTGKPTQLASATLARRFLNSWVP